MGPFKGGGWEGRGEDALFLTKCDGKNKGGVEQNQISLLLMPRLSCAPHFLINSPRRLQRRSVSDETLIHLPASNGSGLSPAK